MRIFTAVIAITTGVLVLLGYFIPGLAGIQKLLLSWVMILAAVATLVGILNLTMVHADKVRRGEKGGVYGALLIISLWATLLFGIALRPDHDVMKNFVMDGIIIPSEAALMGLLTISLLYAAIRLLRRRTDLMGIVFLVTAVFVLLGSATLTIGIGDVPIVGAISRWITQVLALGGARGILIGVSLGILTTGLRVLFGVDRPYGGN